MSITGARCRDMFVFRDLVRVVFSLLGFSALVSPSCVLLLTVGLFAVPRSCRLRYLLSVVLLVFCAARFPWFCLLSLVLLVLSGFAQRRWFRQLVLQFFFSLGC